MLDVEREAGNGSRVGDVERALHHNVCTIVVNLMADVASTVRLDCFGHSLTVDVAPNATLDALDADALRRCVCREASFAGDSDGLDRPVSPALSGTSSTF